MTANPPSVPTALTGAQLRARNAGEWTFPESIPPKELLSEQDIAELATASLEPRGTPQPVFPPRAWLPANEQLAFVVGAVQIALRDLDDQRAIVLRVNIGPTAATLHLQRAPNLDTVRCIHHVQLATGLVLRAFFGEPHCTVMLEWPA